MSTATQTNQLVSQPRTGPVSNKRSIKDTLEGEQFKQAVAKVLPKHLTPDRFIRVAIMAMTRTPKLALCDQASFFQALMSLSQYGLEPDGRRAHLIPFENRKRKVYECQLIIDFKGLAELILRSGIVSYLHADVVCENDDFEYDRGLVIRHKINLKGERGTVYAAYAICRFKDGSEKCDVMSKSDIERIRNRSRAAQNGPWVTDWNEMAKKTVFRRLSKWLPLSPEVRDAVEHEDEFEAKRAELAKPVFDNPAVESRPIFEIPEATEEAQNGIDGQDGDLGPANPDSQESHIGTGAAGATRTETTETEDAKAARLLKAVKGLMKLSGISEVDLIALMVKEGMDDSLGTLVDVSKAALGRLQAVHDKWADYQNKLKS